MATTALGFPYPISTDPPAGHTQIQSLASAVDAMPGIGSYTQTQINAFTAPEKRAGRVVWNSTTSTLQRCDGSTWSDVITSAGGFIAAPSGGSTPFFTAVGDTNTGIYFPAADQLALATNGVVRLLIDSAGLISGTGPSFGFASYTPTLSGWIIGNGTINGVYTKLGRTVWFKQLLTIGSTTTISGSPIFTLPVTADNSFGTGVFQCVYDNGSTPFGGMARMTSTTQVTSYVMGTNGQLNALSTTSPFTWATGHTLMVSGTYLSAT